MLHQRSAVKNLATTMKPLAVGLVTAGLCVTTMALPMNAVPQAYADTYSNLIDAQNRKQASAQREAQLRSKLSGVSEDLTNKIVELDDLTNNQIPQAQSTVESANAAAANAQSEAQSAAERLQAAQQDKRDLEEEIKQTGKDYDDAHAAVAQMARESMHGSDTSDVMSMMTGSTTSKDFIQSMQSKDALSRTEANAASDAASELNTSMNRSQRLEAIEKRIEKLKSDADSKAAQAQSVAAEAQSKRDALDKLRAQGESRRNELESLKSNLHSEAAQQAAQTVLLQSQVDSYNRQYAKEQAEAASQIQNQPQGTTQPGNSSSSSTSTTTPVTPSVPATPSAPVVRPPSAPSTPSSGSGQGTHNGDYGNAYASGQCTYWAYQRRAQMGIGTPSYLGNGGDWWRTAPSYGLRVDHTPQVGAALSFLPGQEGADPVYGHVAVVEAVYGDSIQISEMNINGPWSMGSRVLYNPGRFWFVH